MVLNITKRIKTGVRIDYSIIGNKIQYNEPGELIVMKCLISQVYENMSSELKKIYMNIMLVKILKMIHSPHKAV